MHTHLMEGRERVLGCLGRGCDESPSQGEGRSGKWQLSPRGEWTPFPKGLQEFSLSPREMAAIEEF